MVRRKHKKRLRQKIKFRKTFPKERENAASKNRDEESNVADQHQRSPEAVLCESPHTDALCNEKLSPDVIPKRSKIRLRAKACENDAKVEDEIVRSKIQLSNSSSLRRHESNSKCETFDLTDCYSFRSLFLKKEQSNDEANESADDAPHQNISQLITFCSNLESRLRDNAYIFMDGIQEHANSDEKSGGGFSDEKSQQENRYKSETNDYYSLHKTLSINDFICEMNNYLEKQPSAIITSHFTVRKSSSIADLQSESFDKFIFAGSSVCESADGDDESRGRADKNGKLGSDNNKRFDARLTTNWHVFRKIFSYLWQITKKIRDQQACTVHGASFLAKYKKFINDRWRSYTTLSSSSMSTFPAPSSSSSDANNGGSPITYQSLLAKEDRESEESDHETRKIDFEIQSGYTTPCSGSPPPAKRCRTTLTFEDEDDKVEEQRRLVTRAEITNSFIKKRRKYDERSFPLNLPSREEMPHWNISESTFFLSDVDPSIGLDYDDSCKNLLQQERYRDDAYKHRISRSTTTTRNSQNRSRRRNESRVIITWMIALCVWLKKKLLHLLNSTYKKIQAINSFLTKKSLWKKTISDEERIDYLVTTLRFENEKTLCALSEKMIRLSTDLVQMRMSIETSLNVVTTEINVVRETNKKMVENNATMMWELKKLHKMLEEMQSKFSQSVPLASSCPSSSPACSPPPPPPPPSLLSFPLKIQNSKLSIPPPPPPPLSLASVHSSMPSIQPTTPGNSNKNNKNRTPTRKCFTPSFNRPNITVEDLLKVTLKKAPQNTKDNRRNSIPGPVVSLEMLRNVKLKSAKRRNSDQVGRSPRSGRIMKNRIASNINLSPILTGSENNLERILRQVKLTRPRRLLIGSSNFHDHNFVTETRSLETLTYSQSQSGLDRF